MAKSLIEQLLNLTGLKLPDAKGHYDPSVYRVERTPEPYSGVDKNLQSQDTNSAQGSKALTGVEKYLAKIQPVEQEESQPEVIDQTNPAQATQALTGVEKYLARKQQEEQEKAEAEAAALASMTGVERYLAKLEGKIKKLPDEAAPAKAVSTKNLTGVEKYLAQQKSAAPAPVKQQPKALEETFSEPKSKVMKVEPVVEKAEEPVAAVKEKPAQPAKVAKAVSDLIDLTENAIQCQAATLKGTQCRRTTTLEAIEKTVNQQKYRFCVCSQHNNDDFTPFSELLQSGQ